MEVHHVDERAISLAVKRVPGNGKQTHLASCGGALHSLTMLQILRVRGLEISPVHSLDEARLSGCLGALLQELAEYEIHLCHTDHLTDRQLYRKLTESVLNRFDRRFGVMGWIVDFLLPWDLVNQRVWLRHYANEAERRSWLEKHPNEVLPPHEPALHRRDPCLSASRVS